MSNTHPTSTPVTSRPSSENFTKENPILSSSTPPTSASKTFAEEKKNRRTSLNVFLPNMSSTDSLNLNNSPGPQSPDGSPSALQKCLFNFDTLRPTDPTKYIPFRVNIWNESGSKVDSSTSEKGGQLESKLNRKESYKAQRKSYRMEKKRVASELMNSIQDPTVIVLEDWLKVRGTLKSWTKLWCVLKPGLLIIYKSQKAKSNHWVGTVLLTSCQVIERPSKKDGFCFKLFHRLEQSIWAPRGPERETMGAVIQPLPTAYLIFRAASQAAGKCWMDALELSLRCSALLIRSVSNNLTAGDVPDVSTAAIDTQWSEADYEKHFNDHGAQLYSTLLKYVPPSPPEKSRPKSVQCRRLSVVTRSPCPSPTPLFQHLYLAVAHWERCMSDSPDFVKDLFHYEPDVTHKRSSSMDRPSAIKRDYKNRRKSSPAVPTFPKRHYNLDIDSQADATLQASAGESDSESENGDAVEEVEEFPETSYVYNPEPEFGGAGEQVEELPEEHKSLIWFLVKQVRPGMDLSKVVLPTFILEPRSFLDKLSDSYYHADFLSKAVQSDDAFTRMKTVVQWYMSGFYKKPKGLKKPYNPILGETFRCYWEHPNGSRTFYIAEQVSHHPPISGIYVTNREDGFCISCTILAKSKFYGNSTSAILDGIATLTLLPRGESYTLTIPYAHCKGILMGTLTMELGGKINIECENTGYKAELEFKLKPFIGGSEYTNLVTGKIKLGKETLASISGHWDSKIKIKDTKTGEETTLFEPTPEMRNKRLKRFTVPVSFQGEFESERLWQHVSAAIARDDQVGATEEKTALEEAQRAATKERKAICSEWSAQHFNQDPLSGNWHYKYADLRAWDPRNDVKQYESGYRIQTKTRHQAPMIRTASIISSEPHTLMQTDSRSSLQALKTSRRALAKRMVSGNSTPDHGAQMSSDDSNGHTRSKILETLTSMEKKLDDQSVRITRLQQNVDQLQKQSNDSFFKQSNIITIAIVLFAVLINSVLTAFINRKHYP